MPPSAKNDQTLLSVQYLRGMGAILILVFHHFVAIEAKHPGLFTNFGAAGIGVDTSIVISGFIMWVVTDRRPTKPSAFLQRRVLRIIPVYWLFTLLAANLSTAGGLHVEHSTDYQRIIYSLLFVPQWNTDHPGMVAPLLPQCWTLYLEMAFYLLFALALALPQRFRMPMLVIAIFTTASLRVVVPEPTSPTMAVFSYNIVAEFGFGVLLGWAYTTGRVARLQGKNATALGALLIAVAIGWMLTQDRFPAHRALYWGVPALSVCLGMLLLEPLLRRRPSRLASLFGKASYSLYLSHIGALAFSGSMVGHELTESHPVAALVAQVLFAIAFGMCIYMVLERPLTNASRDYWRRRRARAQP